MLQRRRYKRLLAVTVIALLLLIQPLAVMASDNILDEVKQVLQQVHFQPVPQNVLEAQSIDEVIARLGDKYTQYLTASEFKDFMDSMNRSLCGIGVQIETDPKGALIHSVIKGYSADKVGLKAGDIILEVDGITLAGKPNEFAVSKLRGIDGSSVKVKVLRSQSTFEAELIRTKIELPLVEGQILNNHIGYIAIYSFGEKTGEEFSQTVGELKDKGADCWILDLRNNTGGYIQASFDLLGFLIDKELAVYIQEKGGVEIGYYPTRQSFVLNKPMILLVNKYSASASEITTGALKDHHTATVIGETTYGSGRVKGLFALSNGDYLKTTTNRFYSPANNMIDEVGIAPDIQIHEVDALKAAILLIDDFWKANITDKTGYLNVTTPFYNYAVSISELRKPDNWSAGAQLLASDLKTTYIQLGTKDGWTTINEDWLQSERQKIYYPDYADKGQMLDTPLSKKFTITFDRDIEWASVDRGDIELIKADTGQRINYSVTIKDSKEMVVSPDKPLEPNAEYWLVVGSDIMTKSGERIKCGVTEVLTRKN